MTDLLLVASMKDAERQRMAFTCGEEVKVALSKHSATGTATGVVVRATPDRIQIALRGRGLLLKTGALVHILSSSADDGGGWASVDHMHLAGDVKLIDVTNFRLEQDCTARAARCSVELSLTASYREDQQSPPKKTVGQTLNISVSGMLARFRNPVKDGSVVHVCIHLDGGKVIEALARIVRVMDGGSQGYDVGVEFERFLKGYDHLLNLAPDEMEPAPSREVA